MWSVKVWITVWYQDVISCSLIVIHFIYREICVSVYAMQWLDPLTIQTDTPVQYSFTVCFCGGEIALLFIWENSSQCQLCFSPSLRVKYYQSLTLCLNSAYHCALFSYFSWHWNEAKSFECYKCIKPDWNNPGISKISLELIGSFLHQVVCHSSTWLLAESISWCGDN